jgi:SAM-dependent methyltransferase
MAHPEQLAYFSALKREYPEFFIGSRVAEVGSLDINGSIRSLFDDCDYTGYDIGTGAGVDVVRAGQSIDRPTGWFDVTVSAECFEHNPYWVETFSNMCRMTRPGGLVAISVATTGRAEHGTPRTSTVHSPLTVDQGGPGADYYRNLTDTDFRTAVHLEGWFAGFHFMLCPAAQDLYFWGIVRNGQPAVADCEAIRSSVLSIDAHLGSVNGSVTISHYVSSVGFVPRGVVPWQ